MISKKIDRIISKITTTVARPTGTSNELVDRHSLILQTNKAIHREPYYAFVILVLSIFGLGYSIYIFYSSTKIIPTKEFIPSTTSDTAVHQIPLHLPILPVPNQELNPGKTLSEQETKTVVKEYMINSLNDCFSMNYLNKAKILVQCMGNHFDSQSNAKFEFVQMLMDSNYLRILNKYETSVKLHINEESINLIGVAEVSMPNTPHIHRALWLYELEMYYEMHSVKVKSPQKWQVEMIREESFDKEFPVSIFKIRDME